jgi:DNA (cytosine-5)-methyltransferase 1
MWQAAAEGAVGSRPRLLDLFCGAGGAAVGYHRAGFEVVGVDIRPQPHYPFEFWQQDVLTFEEIDWRCIIPGDYDAIHASPPCQFASRATAWRGSRDSHRNLIPPTRKFLQATGLPYIIENVQEARGQLREPTLLCGSMVGLAVERHRYFEANWSLWQPASCAHIGLLSFDHGGKAPESAYRAAMGCDWMTVEESRQAIPPAYTFWIGRQLVSHLEITRAAGAMP